MAVNWYYQALGDIQGPFTAAGLKRMAETGRLTRDSLVRKGDAGPWVKASVVQGLFENAAPPPGAAARATPTKPLSSNGASRSGPSTGPSPIKPLAATNGTPSAAVLEDDIPLAPIEPNRPASPHQLHPSLRAAVISPPTPPSEITDIPELSEAWPEPITKLPPTIPQSFHTQPPEPTPRRRPASARAISEEEPGFLGSFFDPGFKRYTAPGIIKFLWMLYLIFCGFAFAFVVSQASSLTKDPADNRAFVELWIAVFLLIVSIPLVRLSLEGAIVIFDIAQKLKSIDHRLAVANERVERVEVVAVESTAGGER